MSVMYMALKYMQIAMFVVIAYAAFWAGGLVVDFLAPIIPFLFTGLIGEAVRFALPVIVFYYALRMFGKTK
jgi:hypothetical protein